MLRIGVDDDLFISPFWLYSSNPLLVSSFLMTKVPDHFRKKAISVKRKDTGEKQNTAKNCQNQNQKCNINQTIKHIKIKNYLPLVKKQEQSEK